MSDMRLILKPIPLKTQKTGKTVSINATPSHPVYVRNKATFIPMDSLSSTDELLDNTGQQIKLICSASHTKHCGLSLKNTTPALIYNLEINKKHTYFVSDIKLLVHNNCELALFLKLHLPDLIISKDEGKSFLIDLDHHDNLQRVFSVLQKLEKDNMQPDSYSILVVSHYQQRWLPVDDLNYFLKTRKTANSATYDVLLTVYLGGIKKDINRWKATWKRCFFRLKV